MILNIELAKEKFDRKAKATKYRSMEFKLSFEEYCGLMLDAGIIPEQIGTRSGMYVLGRHNDIGDYIVGNCRFITHNQNVSESDHTVSSETKEKISKKLKNRTYSDETLMKMKIGQRNRTDDRSLSEEHKLAVSLHQKERYDNGAISPFQEEVTCPHCKLTGKKGPMNRWHFDNCKHKEKS